MSYFSASELNSYKLQILQKDFLSLLSEKENFIFIKNNLSVYQYANQQFLELMGLNTLTSLYKKTDYDLCRDIKKARIYLQHDAEVLETEQPLSVNEEVLPQKNKLLRKQMTGTIYPIFTQGSKPKAIMGVVKSKYLPFKLTLETAISMSKEEMDNNFIRRSYPVIVYDKKITLSKREIQCIIELLKGKNAKEIAEIFELKQTTIEFYLENIKEKLGAISKSSLIMTVFNQKVIQQIIL
ncbi:LuxR C-terminal-related transcriptional regulator [Legionella brunensis]|uniref:Transcriptional regulator LuxR n=1 Tax=Legionella brunensis TaxID=29422 RepID=A0A0W0SUP5_9GAMM|nr:LuxR C-terminal-related transcriptional regulator [Legionella brunensis]KTC86988.1 transcriptional regulator LuxR [Legionella brunensis]